jgi:hypothetical protein
MAHCVVLFLATLILFYMDNTCVCRYVLTVKRRCSQIFSGVVEVMWFSGCVVDVCC